VRGNPSSAPSPFAFPPELDAEPLTLGDRPLAPAGDRKPPAPALAPAHPRCGLYRTTEALPGQESRVPEGCLVSFHFHPARDRNRDRDRGLAPASPTSVPQICLPEHNVHNRWRFHRVGLPVLEEAWSQTLEPLPDEGFYALSAELGFPGGKWPQGALLQLGYTRTAEPILFLAQQRQNAVENDLFFGEEGVRVDRSALALLRPLVVFVEPDDDPHENAHAYTRP
jgi:hypothetical protein